MDTAGTLKDDRNELESVGSTYGSILGGLVPEGLLSCSLGLQGGVPAQLNVRGNWNRARHAHVEDSFQSSSGLPLHRHREPGT